MHSSTTLAVILLAASAASPALAAPLNVKQAREFDELMAREPSLLSILKPLGTGVLGGAAVPLLNHFLGHHSSSASSRAFFNLGPEVVNPQTLKGNLKFFAHEKDKRDLASIEQDVKDFIGKFTHKAATPVPSKALEAREYEELNELMAREPSLLSILKPLGTGVLGGAAVPLLNHFLGDHSSSASSRAFNFGPPVGFENDPVPNLAGHQLKTKKHKAQKASSSKRDLASIEQDVKDFIGKFTHKAATAREYDELVARKSILGSLLGATEDSLGTVLKTGTAAGLASGAVGAVGGEVEHLLGNKDSSSKRDLASIEQDVKDFIGKFTHKATTPAVSSKVVEARDLASIEQDVEDFIGKFTHKAATAREYDELVARKSILGSLLGATEDSLGTVLKTGAAAGLASGAVGAAGGEVEHLFGHKDSSSKRDLEERLNLGPIEKGLIGTVTSLGASGAASGLLGKLFGDKDSSSRRELEERLNLGPIEKGLIGTVTSLGASGAASGLLGKLFGDKDSSSRRDVTPEQALAAILLSSRSFDELD
ncbi:hypothetical protein FA95DRAFT_1610597 [Auriscalpium vulgare]|uniref:Uncharacterized protein n=1 Tax=Auriscalpium vulgare TaxID=40419 RepID=A0ACB8RED7_9AGAM|nr:hypothetical protein FA95DRAFT_1610597 [Auriscalpium vulgare]